MKKLIFTSILALLIAAGTTVRAQERPNEYLGLPGDNLNLYAVMKLFQESETLEGFEKNLNDENSRINNLDLNGDNLVDYIMVVDYVDGDVHNIVLRVALNRNENQDVAVFTVQRFSNGSVQIQLIGDEALYGRNYIVEPIYDDNYGETPNPGYTGRSGYVQNVAVVRTTSYEIAAWPLIRFIFLPNYVAWRTSWYWGYYPSYWNPWRPYYWHFYYGYQSNWNHYYHQHYRHWNQPRYARYNDFYYRGMRSHSPQVSVRINKGIYRTTYSHPEQRRDGEALYSRTNSVRSIGTLDNTINSHERRSASQSTRGQVSSGTRSGAERHSSADFNSKSGTNPSLGQKAGVSRRSTSTVSERRSTSTPSGQNTGTPRKSSSTFSDRPASKPSYSKATTTSRRSPVASSDRVVSKPSNSKVTTTSGRSPANVSDKVVSKPSYSQPAVTSRKPGVAPSERVSNKSSYSQPTATSRRSAVASSERVSNRPSSVQRSSNNSNSSQNSQKSGKSRASESSRSSRR